ncbi:hypothetical protein [Parasitella parasitica]|uniref:Uncharacterized protein n=1 Tax=Parasitella parasitica TaxID=35722 RepID=A0A0B7NJU8_9FUNG|nr:hypothetical protein [Parasitella parasitica]
MEFFDKFCVKEVGFSRILFLLQMSKTCRLLHVLLGTPQVNKEFTNDLKKWKVDAHQVVTATSRHAQEARVQARTATEIHELLESIQEGCIFADEGTKQTFMDAMSRSIRRDDT